MWNNPKKDSLIWIVSGPSGSGKTTLCETLLADRAWKRRIVKSVSYTTRPLRRGEKNGRDYVCVPEQEFLDLKRRGFFLETEFIFGYFYGTPKTAVEQARARNRDLLLCIDVKGAQTVRRQLTGGVVTVFILPPRLEVLQQRLAHRSTEDKKDVEKRMNRVKIEISYAKYYDYVVINDRLETALEKIKAIMTAKRCEGEYVLHST